MPKIKLNDSAIDIAIKMSQGNPGGMAVVTDLIKNGDIMPILFLDTLGIYGTDIYILWSDQCYKDTHKLAKLISATQQGHFSADKLVQIAKDQRGKHRLSEDELDNIINSIELEKA